MVDPESDAPLRIAVVGLVHQHAEGLLWNAARRDDLELVGVVEPDRELFSRLASKYGLGDELRFDDTATMLDAVQPEAVSVMTSIADHLPVIEVCAPRGVHALVEKPLAFDAAAAARMAELATEHGVQVLTNFETSWYPSLRTAAALVRDGSFAPLRRMVFRHGHRGPREIGCYEEFLAWLCDPEQNGGGALVDFGCYGAALATWLMDGERPLSVTATASTLKPEIYPDVDDDATIVLRYPTATAVIGASWAWTHDNKEMDLHSETGSLHAGKWNSLARRAPDGELEQVTPTPLPAAWADEWTYLRHVVRGECEVDPLSSIDLNVIVAEILDEARRQVASGR
ncbi:Gfo/Idh/MocA family protein [Engelhardtia mirabilis]